MKHFKLFQFLCILLFYSFIGYSQACSPELFISEYIEGSGSNKAIEIYNPTGADVLLTGTYNIVIYFNGSPTPSAPIDLIGTVMADDVFIIENPGETLNIFEDQQSGSISFNGNDVVALRNGTTNIDVIGQIGFNPPTGEWFGAICTQGTENGKLIRENFIITGDPDGTDPFDPDDEWFCFDQDDIFGTGTHNLNCTPSNELQLQLPAGTDIACGSNYDFGLQSTATNTDIIVTIQNTGNADLTISSFSLVTGSNFSIVSSPIVPLVILSGGSQDITIRFNPLGLGMFNDTLTIINDDADESSCAIFLQGQGNELCSTTTTIIAAQDFETLSSDTWAFTPIHAAITNFWYVTSALSNITSAQSGGSFWGITDLERAMHNNLDHELQFNNIDISTFDNVTLSFNYYTVGVDISDSLEYELFYDNVSQGLVEISANTSSWTEVIMNIPESVNTIQIIFYADLDAGNDQVGIDNLTLSSTNLDEAIWDGTAWSNGTGPTPTISARISGNYNTTTNNISACNLTIDPGVTLRIENNTYVEVENNVMNNGTVTISDEGSFVQNNDAAIYLDVGTGVTQVNKLTASISAWYEYTYWSSPVQGEQIGDTFAQTNPDRRFYYNAANFSDGFAETNNNNDTMTLGQDGVDDNGNVWQYALPADVMQPGVGYACTLSQAFFNTLPPMASSGEFSHTFIGPLNNGVITTQVYRNEAVAMDLDTNWNFIGNPYASALDVDLFFAANVWSTTDNLPMVGAIYLWSHNSSPLETINGNSDLNFPSSDYAVINFTGATAAASTGDGLIPDRYIPSGQGFFMAMSDAYLPTTSPTTNVDGETVEEGEVIFRNDMRVNSNNTQFFKSNITENNKLWLNLKNDNGVLSQVLIGYVDGATDNYDGMAYDAAKNVLAYNASIYSIIDGSDKKFGIQGKAKMSINTDEEISLGLYNSIPAATVFTISIPRMEGGFLNNNIVYLKDTFLNTVHNLSNNDYTFTTNVGEFNNRFKIAFNENTLSVEEFETNKQNLSIIELQDDEVKFSITSGNLTIKSIKIMDLLGRDIYYFQGSSNVEVFNLSNLNTSIYIAQIKLSNGELITKKAIKK